MDGDGDEMEEVGEERLMEEHYDEEEQEQEQQRQGMGSMRGRGGGAERGLQGQALAGQLMRQKLEEFRMAKLGKGGGIRRGGGDDAAGPVGPPARKPAVPQQAHRVTTGTASSSCNSSRGYVKVVNGRPTEAAAGRGGAGGRGKSAAGGSIKRSNSTAAAAAAAAEDEEMKALVALHNKKFRAAQANPAYVPALSVKETKKWEAVSGKVYRSLSMREREMANAEIKEWKAKEG